MFLLAFISAAAAFMADLASVVGLMELLGSIAFRILKTAQAVPIACPAASSPSVAASAAWSPYLHWEIFENSVLVSKRTSESKSNLKQGEHAQ